MTFPEIPGYEIIGELTPNDSPDPEPTPEQKREWMKAGLCMNCGRKGAHYVPPSGGGRQPGFFACKDINRYDDERANR